MRDWFATVLRGVVLNATCHTPPHNVADHLTRLWVNKMQHNINDDLQFEADDIMGALRELQSNPQHRKGQLFSLLYPAIVEMLEKNVTQKAILATLAEKGLKLHPARVKERMAMEAQKIPSISGSRVEEEGKE